MPGGGLTWRKKLRRSRCLFHHVRLADGDRLLLCTDGLTDRVADDEIAAVLGRPAPPQEQARVGLLGVAAVPAEHR